MEQIVAVRNTVVQALTYKITGISDACCCPLSWVVRCCHVLLSAWHAAVAADPTAAAFAAEVQRQAAAAGFTGGAAPSGAAATAAHASTAAAAAAPAPKKRGGGRKRAAADPAAGGVGSQADGPGVADDVGAAPAKRARATAAKKEYMPRAGTANYAFMVTLYLVSSALRCSGGEGFGWVGRQGSVWCIAKVASC